MRISLIKKLNEYIPYWAKRPFARFIRNRLICNHTFLDTYQMLENADRMSESEKEQLQLNKLKSVLKHAYENTQYYRNLFDENGFDYNGVTKISDIQKLPLLRREMLAENLEQLSATDVPDYYEVSTGGTSGGAAKILMGSDAIYKEWAFVYHYWSKFGYDYKKSKLATFRGVDMGGRIHEINPLYAEIRMNPFIMNRSNIQEYNREINKYGASFIYGYPSSVYSYCKLTKEAGINVEGKFQAALLISENLYPFQEEMIRSVLKCPIAIFYGHTERCVFAERYDDGYKFNPLYGVTEVNADGEPIVTGFVNGKFPLIRYVVDDKIEPVSKSGDKISCKEMNAYEVIDSSERFEITGHKDSEVIYGKNGEYFVGVQALDFHGMLSDNFSEFQLAQKIPGELIIRYVSDKEVTAEEIISIIKKCRYRLGEAFSFKVEQVDKLQLTPRGKYKLIVQYMNPGDMKADNGKKS